MLAKLIKNEAENIRRLNIENLEAGGEQPFFPIMFVYLGEDAEQNLEYLYQEIYQLWPVHAAHILLLHVSACEGGIQYAKLEGKELKEISQAQLADAVSRLIGVEANFSNVNRMLRHTILNTSDVQSFEDYQKQLALLKQLSNDIPSAFSMRDTLFLLVNEELSKEKLVGEIRRHLAKYETYMQEQKTDKHDSEDTTIAKDYPMKDVYFISNRKSSGHLMSDWRFALEMVGFYSAQLNQSHCPFTATLGAYPGVKAFAFSKQSKPVEDISKVLVVEFIKELDAILPKPRPGDINTDKVKQMYGIDRAGNFTLIDTLLQDEAFQVDVEFLETLPRRSMDNTAIHTLGYEEANKLTMGALDAYVKVLEGRLKDRLQTEESLKSFQDSVSKHYGHADIASLKDISLSDYMERRTNPTQSNALDAIKMRIKENANRSEEILQIFETKMKEMAVEAEEILKAWHQLINRLPEIPMPGDLSIHREYGTIVRNYVQQNAMDLNAEFQDLRDASGIQNYLEKHLNKILTQDSIFQLGFESELRKRIQNEDEVNKARDRIARSLTNAQHVPLFYRTTFDDPSVIASSICIREVGGINSLDTMVRQILEGEVPGNQGVSYYNIRSKNHAVALKILKVEYTQLYRRE